MLVEVIAPDGAGTKEWVILELQGTLAPVTGSSMDGLTIGHVSIKPDGKTAALTIGNHRVSGSVVTLSKPIALLQRDDSHAGSGDKAAGAAFVVSAVVRRKLLFNDRPQPIISAASGGLAALGLKK